MRVTFSQPPSARPGNALRPIAVLSLEPEELERRGVRFHPTASDGLDTARAGLVELADGRQFGLLRYDHAPASGTELLADERANDLERDLNDLLQALGLSEDAVSWRLDPAAAERPAQALVAVAAPPSEQAGALVSWGARERAREWAERLREHPAAARLVLAPQHGTLGLSHAPAAGAWAVIEVADDVTRVLVYTDRNVLEAEVTQAHPAFHEEQFANKLVVELLVNGIVAATATVELAVSPIGSLGGRAHFLADGQPVPGAAEFDIVVRPGEPDR